MEKIFFFAKIILTSGLLVGLIGAGLGRISMFYSPDHAHQILPTWLIMGFMGLILGKLTGLVVAIYFVIRQMDSWKLAVRYAVMFCVFELVVMMLWFWGLGQG